MTASAAQQFPAGAIFVELRPAQPSRSFFTYRPADGLLRQVS